MGSNVEHKKRLTGIPSRFTETNNSATRMQMSPKYTFNLTLLSSWEDDAHTPLDGYRGLDGQHRLFKPALLSLSLS